MNRIGTILAYVVACVILAIGFAGFLLVVTDSDATQSSITLWSSSLSRFSLGGLCPSTETQATKQLSIVCLL